MNKLTDFESKIFKEEIVKRVVEIVVSEFSQHGKWVKTDQAREILGCSRGKIQSLREKRMLEHKKIGGTYYYSMDSLLNKPRHEIK